MRGECAVMARGPLGATGPPLLHYTPGLGGIGGGFRVRNDCTGALLVCVCVCDSLLCVFYSSLQR